MKKRYPWACANDCSPRDRDTNGWCPCDPQHASHPTEPQPEPTPSIELFATGNAADRIYMDIIFDEDAMRDPYLRRGLEIVRQRRFPGIH